MQRGVVAQLHEELGSTTERLQDDLAEWQGRCEDLEGQLQEQQQHSLKLEQKQAVCPAGKVYRLGAVFCSRVSPARTCLTNRARAYTLTDTPRDISTSILRKSVL